MLLWACWGILGLNHEIDVVQLSKDSHSIVWETPHARRAKVLLGWYPLCRQLHAYAIIIDIAGGVFRQILDTQRPSIKNQGYVAQNEIESWISLTSDYIPIVLVVFCQVEWPNSSKIKILKRLGSLFFRRESFAAFDSIHNVGTLNSMGISLQPQLHGYSWRAHGNLDACHSSRDSWCDILVLC